ncbi:MAG: hypothetical protein U0133_10610 [Gemmatimonadales bacterium]
MGTREERRREPAQQAADCFVLATRDTHWWISTAMARAVEAELVAVPAVRWLTFVDLTGARIRLRADQVTCLAQFFAEQRAAERRFCADLRREARADEGYDD